MKRTWDESKSEQWRYLLSNDSQEKRNQQKREERIEQAEGELTKHRGLSKRKRRSQETQKENRTLARTKREKEILYSSSPGNTKNYEIENETTTTTTPTE